MSKKYVYEDMNSAVASTLAQIKYYEKALDALSFAERAADEGYPSEQMKQESHCLRMKLYERLNHAYTTLFMWGNLIGGEVQKEANKIAVEKFLSDGKAVMQYLSNDGRYPGSYFSDDDEEFRKDIRALAIEKGALDPVCARVACDICGARKDRSCRDDNFKRIPPHKERSAAALKESVTGKKDSKNEGPTYP